MIPPEARVLRVPGADHAVLDVPTGRLMVSRGHNDVHGDPSELRRFARAILEVCDEITGRATAGTGSLPSRRGILWFWQWPKSRSTCIVVSGHMTKRDTREKDVAKGKGHVAPLDPKEIVDALKRNRNDSDEIRRSADERRERLRGAVDGPRKKFSL
ncbi:hypothetical protein [Ancylobacter defluvii]|uniref:Uncharacterized protein n=1 Tax=Ancylobacter defluvii TaxID=1282440 RepID=A0A9W6K3B3_9HYPH|nr:hypothetical protein [Ancylobacter defluvii]MBS7588307.1 hypothetical protein [Ancylobacter defluvii]GLK86704.1 hypothetical protein GCM10017653_47740 [Ancylobacter defluvii]